MTKFRDDDGDIYDTLDQMNLKKGYSNRLEERVEDAKDRGVAEA